MHYYEFNAKMCEKICFIMNRGQMMRPRKIIDTVTQGGITSSLCGQCNKEIGMLRPHSLSVSLPRSAKWASVWVWMARVHRNLHQGWHWAQDGHGCGCIVSHCHHSGSFVHCSDACLTACGC